MRSSADSNSRIDQILTLIRKLCLLSCFVLLLHMSLSQQMTSLGNDFSLHYVLYWYSVDFTYSTSKSLVTKSLSNWMCQSMINWLSIANSTSYKRLNDRCKSRFSWKIDLIILKHLSLPRNNASRLGMTVYILHINTQPSKLRPQENYTIEG